MLSLITIIALSFLGTMNWELSTARRNYDNQKARALAMMGVNTAVADIRQALDTWDNPYYNFSTNPPTFFWSVSPGIITRWSYTQTAPLTNYPLFSQGTTDLVNLNAVESDGSYPIAGETNAPSTGVPNISVYWLNVLRNPGNVVASADNPIVGRYAFWVDDDSSKININTADGTMKYLNSSLGIGTPSEVSLQVLQQGGTNIVSTTATNLVYLARSVGFNSPHEILRTLGTTPDFYTNNVFNLTISSRSPDLNIFGQPKMALMPILGDSVSYYTYLNVATNMVVNAITLQPVKEIYPTPAQLPAYSLVNPGNGSQPTWFPTVTNSITSSVPWPLAFRAFEGIENSGAYIFLGAGQSGGTYTQTNYPWVNGMMLANYLAGTNAANTAINWPPFSGTAEPSMGFAGKYTPRQIDSIVIQVAGLGSKEISPDYFFSNDLGGTQNAVDRGLRAITTPFLFFGWLSHEWVNSLARVPKVDAMEMEVTTHGSVGTYTGPTSNYEPPSVSVDIWQEWWLPAAYLGGNNTIPPSSPSGGAINFGVVMNRGVLNLGDLCMNTATPTNSPPDYAWPPAPLPKPDLSDSYWGNQLLTNNQGVDFQGNPSNYHDPDPGAGAQFHNPYSFTNGAYYGTGEPTSIATFSTPFSLHPLQSNKPSVDWLPGEMRCVINQYGSPLTIPIQTNAGTASNPTLAIGGGIQVRSEMIGYVLNDLDPTPLDSIRGEQLATPGMSGGYIYDGELWSDSAHLLGNPSMTVRDLNIAAVIPISLSVTVPPNSNGSVPAKSAYILARVADPLVNKFPGDWITTTSTSPITVPTYWGSAGGSYSSTNEYSSGFHTYLTQPHDGITPDPDSYWLPQADCAVSFLGDIASQTLIPRSARFPNIGYLQYLRTGIIPDDETLPYQPKPGLTYSQYQHGTPFRLLSYAPSTDTSNQETTRATTAAYGPASQAYPDWAMLDLLYVPSILAPYGGPYGYYDTNSPPVWQGFGNPRVLADNSTGGGSTPGRINPNGMVIYTTNATTPQPGICRPLPLQAVLQGLIVNQSLNSSSTSPTPGFTGGSAVDFSYSVSNSDPQSIPNAIENYLRSHGPLKMPAELCNVPEIAALRSSANPTRNDLIRQIVGNLTTQSNTFSIWVAGQSISKSKANVNYGIYESGDQVSASVRYHFVVERYLDPGADGVYGNAVTAGPDGLVGTFDDPVDPANHPFLPRYLYRVLSVEEIR